MAQSILFNGVVYAIPDVSDDNWGQVLTDYFIAIASGSLQKSGGTFTLTADTNFGATYGLISNYFKSRTVNVSTSGVVRLANSDGIGWRNALNSADYLLKASTDGFLQYNSVDLVGTSLAQTLTNKTISGGSNTITGISLTTSVSGTLPVSSGGTGAVSQTAYGVLVGGTTSTGAFQSVTPGGVGLALLSGGPSALPTWGSVLSNPMTTLGDTLYTNASPAATRLPGNTTTTKMYLSQTGTGSVSAAPAWAQTAFTDISGTVPNSQLAQMAATTIKGNNTGSTANAADLTAAQVATVLQAAGVHPAGEITMFGGSSAPTGWLLCDGSAVSRTTYSALFAAISTTYGTGNGTTTFNVPNLQGVFPRGGGSQVISGITFTGTLGATQLDSFQGHQHSKVTATAGSQSGKVQIGSSTSTADSFVTDAITTDGTNGTPRVAAETRPANVGVTFIIKT